MWEHEGARTCVCMCRGWACGEGLVHREHLTLMQEPKVRSLSTKVRGQVLPCLVAAVDSGGLKSDPPFWLIFWWLLPQSNLAQ